MKTIEWEFSTRIWWFCAESIASPTLVASAVADADDSTVDSRWGIITVDCNANLFQIKFDFPVKVHISGLSILSHKRRHCGQFGVELGQHGMHPKRWMDCASPNYQRLIKSKTWTAQRQWPPNGFPSIGLAVNWNGFSKVLNSSFPFDQVHWLGAKQQSPAQRPLAWAQCSSRNQLLLFLRGN